MIVPDKPLTLRGFKGVSDEALDIDLLPNEASDNRNIWTDQIQGVLFKMFGFKKVGSLGSTLLLEDCEQTTGWTFISGVSGSADTSVPVIGTKSIKMTIAHATLSTGVAAYKTITSADWSAYAGIGCYVRSSVALAAGDYQFCVSEAGALATPSETINIPALAAGVWQYVYLPFAAAGATRDAVLTFGIKIAVDKGDLDFYLDNIDLVRTDDFPVDLCETIWTAKTYVTSSTDDTVFKQGTYSAKHIVATGFTTGIISTHVIPSMDLSKYSYIGFWLRSTVTLPAGIFSLLLDSVAACGGTPIKETLTIKNSLVKDEWTHCVVKLATPSADTAIISVGLTANSTLADLLPTIYIDDIRALKPVVAAKKYERTDGSILIVASNGNSVFKSVDTGANWTLIADGLNSAYYTWICAFKNSCFWGNGADYNMELTTGDVVNIYSGTEILGVRSIYYMPKARYMWVHQDTIPMLLYATDPVTVRYGDPVKLPGESDWFPATRAKDLQASGDDFLMTAIAFAERSVIYLTNTFVVLSGSDHANFDWLPRDFNIGCTMRESPQTREGGWLIWGNNEGIYRMNETFVPELISDKIKNKFSLLVQPSLSDNYWVQSTYAELVAGEIETIDTTTVYGKIMPKDFAPNSLSPLKDYAYGVIGTSNVATELGSFANITDGDVSTYWKGVGGFGLPVPYVVLDLGSSVLIKFVQVVGNDSNNPVSILIGEYSTDNVNWTSFHATNTNVSLPFYYSNTGFTARYIKISGAVASSLFLYSVQVYLTNFGIVAPLSLSSTFWMDAIDYGNTPPSYGNLTFNIYGMSLSNLNIYISTSSDGSTWDTAILLGTYNNNATPNGNHTFAIATGGGSSVPVPYTAPTVKRYVKIGFSFYFNNANPNLFSVPYILNMFMGSSYISVTHNTGAKSQWGQFLVNDVPTNQTVSYEIRSAVAEATLTADTTGLLWHPIVPTNVISEPVENIWVQVRVTFNTNNYLEVPTMDWFQLNWVTASTSTLPTTLVSSLVHNDRYYLFGMLKGDDYNMTGFCLDKNWNWQLLYGYPVGCCFDINEEPYFGSSFDSRVMRLFTGNIFDYGDWTSAIDSYWQTGKLFYENLGNDKLFLEFVHYFESVTSASVTTIYYDVSKSGVFTSLGTIDVSDSLGELRLLSNGVLKGRTLKLKILNAVLNGEMKIYKIEIYYQIFERTY